MEDEAKKAKAQFIIIDLLGIAKKIEDTREEMKKLRRQTPNDEMSSEYVELMRVAENLKESAGEIAATSFTYSEAVALCQTGKKINDVICLNHYFWVDLAKEMFGLYLPDAVYKTNENSMLSRTQFLSVIDTIKNGKLYEDAIRIDANANKCITLVASAYLEPGDEKYGSPTTMLVAAQTAELELTLAVVYTYGQESMSVGDKWEIDTRTWRMEDGSLLLDPKSEKMLEKFAIHMLTNKVFVVRRKEDLKVYGVLYAENLYRSFFNFYPVRSNCGFAVMEPSRRGVYLACPDSRYLCKIVYRSRSGERVLESSMEDADYNVGDHIHIIGLYPMQEKVGLYFLHQKKSETRAKLYTVEINADKKMPVSTMGFLLEPVFENKRQVATFKYNMSRIEVIDGAYDIERSQVVVLSRDPVKDQYKLWTLSTKNDGAAAETFMVNGWASSESNLYLETNGQSIRGIRKKKNAANLVGAVRIPIKSPGDMQAAMQPAKENVELDIFQDNKTFVDIVPLKNDAVFETQ